MNETIATIRASVWTVDQSLRARILLDALLQIAEPDSEAGRAEALDWLMHGRFSRHAFDAQTVCDGLDLDLSAVRRIAREGRLNAAALRAAMAHWSDTGFSNMTRGAA